MKPCCFMFVGYRALHDHASLRNHIRRLNRKRLRGRGDPVTITSITMKSHIKSTNITWTGAEADRAEADLAKGRPIRSLRYLRPDQRAALSAPGSTVETRIGGITQTLRAAHRGLDTGAILGRMTRNTTIPQGNATMPPTVYEFTGPAHWAPYLVNGDASGLDDADRAEADAALDAKVNRHGSCHVCDCSEPSFRNRPGDYGTLSGDYCTYTYLA